MAAHNELGKAGEKEACAFLLENGFEIVATNWRKEKAEVDIIARKNDLLLLVEVKTRTTDYFGTPAEAVGKKKQQMMVRAAEYFLEEKEMNVEVRYDIISIILNDKEKKIVHIEDAFYPFASEIDE